MAKVKGLARDSSVLIYHVLYTVLVYFPSCCFFTLGLLITIYKLKW